MRILSLNQDKGIRAGSHKGAAVHLRSMRYAFAQLGHQVVPLDDATPTSLALMQAIQKSTPIDMVYERYALGKTAGAEFSRLFDVPLIVEVNAPLAEEASRWRGVAQTQQHIEQDQCLFQQAEYVLAVSPETAEYAVRRGASVGKTFVCPNGIDENIFYRQDKRQCKQALGISDSKLVIGFHGRLRPWHAFDRLVQVTAELRSRDVPVYLLAVGEGEFDQCLRSKLGQDDYQVLNWVGYEKIGQVIGAVNILPLTYDESQPCYFSPLKLHEGMACGAVPIVPDLGNLAEVVAHGDTGFVYNPANYAKELPAYIEELWRSPLTRSRMVDSAVKSVKGKTWGNIAATVIARVEGQ